MVIYVTTLLLLIGALVGGGSYYWFKSYVSSAPNEWMLVIRNGNLIKHGVGISFHKRWGDKIVKFPSKIHRVNFTAQQVTQEKQGIEISGVIIWEVYRVKDGPLKAYKYLGKDLSSSFPKTANDILQQMSGSIVRHRIANSTIEEILKQRDQVRTEIKDELNKIVNGWGVWLESVEITDVKILSGRLFKHLQTEYREDQRSKAQIIKLNTQNELNLKKMKQDQAKAKKDVLNNTLNAIYKAKEQLKIRQEEQKVLTKEQQIEKLKIESNNKLKKHKEKTNNDFLKYKRDLALKNNLKNIQKNKELEKKKRQIQDLESQKLKANQDARMEVEKLNKESVRKLKEENAKLENEMRKGLTFKKQSLLASEKIFKKMRLTGMNIIQLGSEKGDPTLDFVKNVMDSIEGLKADVSQ